MGLRGHYRVCRRSAANINSSRTIFVAEAPSGICIRIHKTAYSNTNETTSAQYQGYWTLIDTLGTPGFEDDSIIPAPFDPTDQAAAGTYSFNLTSGSEPTYDDDFQSGSFSFNHLVGYRLAEYDRGLVIYPLQKWGFRIYSSGTIPAHIGAFECEFEEYGG